MSSDHTNNADAIAAEIDRMVQANTPDVTIVRTRTTPDMRMDGEGNVTITSPPSPQNQRVGDTPGLDLGAEVASINEQITRLTGELAEQTFDPKTGKATFVRDGNDRSIREAQLTTLRAALEYQQQRNAQIQAQRDADAENKLRDNTEEAVSFAYTGGDPAKQAALKRALAEAEATEAAAMIIAIRRGKR